MDLQRLVVEMKSWELVRLSWIFGEDLEDRAA